MANSRSAKKRIKINKRNNIQNNTYKSLIKYYEKVHLNLINEYENSGDLIVGQSPSDSVKKKLLASLALVVSRIDKAVKKKFFIKTQPSEKKIIYSKKLLKRHNLKLLF